PRQRRRLQRLSTEDQRPSDRGRSLHGALPIFTKPYGLPQLCAILEKALEWRQLRARVDHLEELHRLKDEFMAMQFFQMINTRPRSEEHTSELQSPYDLVCRLLLEKKNTNLHV